MRAHLQRVNYASVVVHGKTTGAIDRGLMILVGFGKDDTTPPLDKMCEKLLHLRVFPDDEGRFDQSVKDINGGMLLVPQFTLYGETRKGRRPDFFNALKPELASKHFDSFVNIMRANHEHVETGIFGADMKVSLENDGPVTLMLELGQDS